MGRIYESLKNYFEDTPKDVLDNDWKEIEHLNEIGPDVMEYAEFVKENFGIFQDYSNSKKDLWQHKYDVVKKLDNENISAESKFFFAA